MSEAERQAAERWETLPARMKRVADLYAQGCTHENVAKRLGIAVPTVRAHLDQVRLRLRIGRGHGREAQRHLTILGLRAGRFTLDDVDEVPTHETYLSTTRGTGHRVCSDPHDHNGGVPAAASAA